MRFLDDFLISPKCYNFSEFLLILHDRYHELSRCFFISPESYHDFSRSPLDFSRNSSWSFQRFFKFIQNVIMTFPQDFFDFSRKSSCSSQKSFWFLHKDMTFPDVFLISPERHRDLSRNPLDFSRKSSWPFPKSFLISKPSSDLHEHVDMDFIIWEFRQ